MPMIIPITTIIITIIMVTVIMIIIMNKVSYAITSSREEFHGVCTFLSSRADRGGYAGECTVCDLRPVFADIYNVAIYGGGENSRLLSLPLSLLYVLNRQLIKFLSLCSISRLVLLVHNARRIFRLLRSILRARLLPSLRLSDVYLPPGSDLVTSFTFSDRPLGVILLVGLWRHCQIPAGPFDSSSVQLHERTRSSLLSPSPLLVRAHSRAHKPAAPLILIFRGRDDPSRSGIIFQAVSTISSRINPRLRKIIKKSAVETNE